MRTQQGLLEPHTSDLLRDCLVLLCKPLMGQAQCQEAAVAPGVDAATIVQAACGAEAQHEECCQVAEKHSMETLALSLGSLR